MKYTLAFSLLIMSFSALAFYSSKETRLSTIQIEAQVALIKTINGNTLLEVEYTGLESDARYQLILASQPCNSETANSLTADAVIKTSAFGAAHHLHTVEENQRNTQSVYLVKQNQYQVSHCTTI